jgi:hypothetical protein
LKRLALEQLNWEKWQRILRFLFTDPSNFLPCDSSFRILTIPLANKSKLLTCYLFCCRVSRSHYLNTEEFIDAVAEELRTRLTTQAKL